MIFVGVEQGTVLFLRSTKSGLSRRGIHRSESDTRTGSTSSLGGGITGGIALGVAFFLMQVPETRDLGEAVGFGAAVLFAAIFAIRLASTGKPVPSGPLLGLSAATSVIFALSYLETRVPLS